MADSEFSDVVATAQSAACRMEAIVALVKVQKDYIQMSSAALSSLLEPICDDMFTVVEALQMAGIKKS